MTKLLKRIVVFLERKFPDRVELTFKEFNELHEELGALNRAYQDLAQELLEFKQLKADVQKYKDEVSKLHVVLGFSGGRGASLER